jgi:hypothetical protein
LSEKNNAAAAVFLNGRALIVSFSAYYFLKVHLHHLKKSQKEDTKQQESKFLTIFPWG